ncbi:MAG TPA: hypothetical protein DCR17_08195 [Verrucomicrobiales bacterium]|nr:hypothetical protein [Verrucomicrobiales bacterium]
MTTSLLKFSSCLRSSNPTSDRTGWAPPGVGIKSSKSIYKAFKAMARGSFLKVIGEGHNVRQILGLKRNIAF